MCDMTRTLRPVEFNISFRQIKFPLLSIAFVMCMILISSSLSLITMPNEVIAQSSDDDDDDDESEGVDDESEGVDDESEGVDDESEGVDDESEGLQNFVANGGIDSMIYTVSGNWEAGGKWALSVSDGNVRSFDTDMNWTNGTSGHTHEFRNFRGDDNIGLSPDQSLTAEGIINVGTNQAITWYDIPVEIVIQEGKIITITVDDEDTGNHFGGQSIHGTVQEITPCNTSPAAGMQIVTECT